MLPLFVLAQPTLAQDDPADTSTHHCLITPDQVGLVVISDTTTSIIDNAFDGCLLLETVQIPDSVTSIGRLAFNRVLKLGPSVVIPNTVTAIGERAFSGCGRLANIVIPNSVVAIGIHAFPSCLGFGLRLANNNNNPRGYVQCVSCFNRSVVAIPDSVVNITDMAFGDCTHVTSFVIANSVTAIIMEGGTSATGEAPFYGCTRLTSVVIPKHGNFHRHKRFPELLGVWPPAGRQQQPTWCCAVCTLCTTNVTRNSRHGCWHWSQCFSELHKPYLCRDF